MKSALILSALLGLASLSFAESNSMHLPGASVAVIMEFEDPYSPSLLDAMKSELERIMRPSNLQLEWRFYEESLGKEIFGNLVVVRFKGPCRGADLPATAETEATLGLTHLSGNDILPYADVNCGRIKSLILGAIRSENFLRTELIFGRAVGRVLAHELYHILARTTKHADSGLAKRVLTPQDLVAHEENLEELESQMIREGLAAPAFAGSP